MTDHDDGPDDDFAEMLRRLFSGQMPGADPEQLAAMGVDPAMLQGMMAQLQGAFTAGAEGIPWDAVKRQALHIANQDDHGLGSGGRDQVDEAFALATLWLGEATTVSELAEAPQPMTRGGWVEATLPVWQELAEPVATSIADALTSALAAQAPEQMQEAIAGASRMLRAVGGSLFAGQLGQVIGQLSKEVVSGGDVGIPILPAGSAAVLPQNLSDFGADLQIPRDQIALYLATRELAHARLFRHAKWLRLLVITQVTEFARGVRVDTEALEDLAGQFDPSHPDELRHALESGALLPPRTPEQTAALTRLENLLALIEGWVDVVTADATGRLPSAARMAETVRRRRAVGGPAEKALASLVGLELRPRRMREAAAMWRAVTAAVGIADRDALWDYPDLMPTADDIDNPAALIGRLEARARGEQAPRDEMDDALDALLRAAADGPEAGDGSGPGEGPHEPTEDDGSGPEGPTPV